MYIDKVKIGNFRLLKDTMLDFKDKLAMLIGRNNSGKTSFLVLFEKFYNGQSFDYNDFSISLRGKIGSIEEATDVNELSIKMILEINYEENDNLENISEFILDLDPACTAVKILFEASINKEKLLKAIATIGALEKNKYIMKNITSFIDKKIYIFDSYDDLKTENRFKLVKKDLSDVKRVIDFQIIHAKRDVASSEESNSKKILSILATKYFNDNNINEPDKFHKINDLIQKMDTDLTPNYGVFFESFLKNAKEFLNLSELKVISNLKADELFKDSSQVIYGKDSNFLPEYYNGLGYMNILYLLLNIEMKISNFIANDKDIKLLFIEEPEAHTHPQLQYIFASKIEELLESVTGLQTIITTHSPHIISQSKFESIRYLSKVFDEKEFENIVIKNFYTELSERYTDQDEFAFLKQYLTIESSELFFASKIIFIEGITEKMLLPYFISQYDEERKAEEKRKKGNGETIEKDYIPISSQSISIIQVGANAKVFRHFLEFLDIKTLVITDIDSVKAETKLNKKGEQQTSYVACPIGEGTIATSNETIKYYFGAPTDIKSDEFKNWIKDIIDVKIKGITEKIKVVYQKKEENYHARSFEDAFFNINMELIKKNIVKINGLKNLGKIDEISESYTLYDLITDILAKKSDLASSLLYLTLTDKTISWKAPSYIEEGLSWISQ